MSKISLDANVLVYGVDASDPAKHRAARRIIALAARHDCVLILQALAELFFVLTKRGKLGVAEARARIRELQTLFPLALPSGRSLGAAIDVSERYRINFRDAMLLAVAREAAVTTLFTENLQDGQRIDGVLCVNPFARSKPELARLMR